MDLRSGSLYWPTLTGAPDHPAIDRDVSADVAVIGGGITGALVALHLAEAGVSAVVLDRRRPGCGSTAASTGLLQYEIDTPLTRLTDLVGPDHARRAYATSAASLGWMREVVARLDDDCGLVARPSLYLACEPDDAAELRAECDARRAIGLDVQYLSASDLRRTYGIDRPAAIRSALALEVDPYRLAIAALRRAAGLGARVFGHTCVDRYTAAAAGVTVHTDRGPAVAARHVVFATGYETPAVLRRSDLCRLKSTYALVTAPSAALPPGWRDRSLIWESGDPYFYARTTPDGRVIAGGADDDLVDPARRDARLPGKVDELMSMLRALFPALDAGPEFAWAGTFAETPDGLPLIGPSPAFPRGLFALGYGGNGITFSLIAARVLTAAVRGRHDPATELFRFDR